MSEITFEEGGLIEVDLIDFDSNNARKKFDKTALNELSESLVNVGLINPITVSRVGIRYMVIAGERRLKAAKLLGWKKIPSIIIEGNDDKLKEVQLIENCQRRDMNPIEELDAFMGLISKDYTPADIANHIGKSTTYVLTRLNLIRLSDRAKKLLYQDDLNMAQCKNLVVMSEELQEKALDNLNYTDGVGQIMFLPAKSFYEFFMQNQAHKLSSANFDIENEELNKKAGACIKCPHNSTVNSVLFGSITKESLCSNPKCYVSKINAQITLRIIEWEKEGLEVIEASQYHSDVFAEAYNYSPVPEDVLKKKNFVVETMLIIREGYGDAVGNFYPVYSQSQIDKIRKDNRSTSATVVDAKQSNKLKAVSRYKDLVVSKISENFANKDKMLTNGIKINAVFNLYTYIALDGQAVFLETFVPGFKKDDDFTYSTADKCFVDNISHIEKELDKALAIASLMQISSDHVDQDSDEYKIIEILANETKVDIQKCKNEVSKELDVELD